MDILLPEEKILACHFLKRRSQHVVAGDSHSSWISVDSWVPQGTVITLHGPHQQLSPGNPYPVPTVCRWLPAVSTHPIKTGPADSPEWPQEFRRLCALLGTCVLMHLNGRFFTSTEATDSYNAFTLYEITSYRKWIVQNTLESYRTVSWTEATI